jgi:hypothetical protein
MLFAAVASVCPKQKRWTPSLSAAPLILLRKFRGRALQNRIGPYGSNPGKKSRSAVLHCGINRVALMRCDKLRKKMPPSGWKTAPILRVDPALFFISPSGARAMQQRPSGLGR